MASNDHNHPKIGCHYNEPLVAAAAYDEQDFIFAHGKKHFARLVARAVRDYDQKLASDPELAKFDTHRFADPTDFDYRFRHRYRLPAWVRKRLEIIAAKLEYKRKDGSPGFFAKMQANQIDWKSHISVIATIRGAWADSVIRCGIWTKGSNHKRNSGRCHQHDVCSLCVWVDHLRFLTSAFAIDSGAFTSGRNWFAIHLSVRDSKENSRAVGKRLEPEDYDFVNDSGMYSEIYADRPVPLEGDNDIFGIQTCRYVFLAVQKALDAIYDDGTVDGYRQKLEVALSLTPTRGLPHGHAIACGGETNPQLIADELYAEMDAVLTRYRAELVVDLWPSVRVYAIPSPLDLLRCAKYLEKAIPLGLLTEEVLNRPAAYNPDGTPNRRVFKALESSLSGLPDRLKSLSGSFRAFDREFYNLKRRRSLGRMRCGKKFAGLEPEWHEWQRERNAEKKAKRRAKSKDAGDLIPPKKKEDKQRPMEEAFTPPTGSKPTVGTVYGPSLPAGQAGGPHSAARPTPVCKNGPAVKKSSPAGRKGSTSIST